MSKKSKTTKKLESFFQKGVTYSITLSPPDKYQFLKAKVNRYRKFHNFVYANTIGWRFDYNLFIELSEPKECPYESRGPRLHLHGVIRFNTVQEIFKFLSLQYAMLLSWTRVNIDTIKELPVWTTYCTKQRFMPIDNRISSNSEPSFLLSKTQYLTDRKKHEPMFTKKLGEIKIPD